MEIKKTIISQYIASLTMLKEAVNKADNDVWNSKGYRNPFWQIAYHALFYTDLYLSENEKKFTPWMRHRNGYNAFAEKSSTKEISIEPYYPKEIIEYAETIFASLQDRIVQTDLDSTSGFFWLPFNKLELHIYNIRHIQHHTGQLIERLREEKGIAVNWIGKADC